MNYKKHYIKLIKKALSRQLIDGYTEKHHIFPISIFGENNSIVKLSAKEHYIAHFLLWKYYKHRNINSIQSRKMSYAFNQMTWNHTGKRYVSNTFSIAREAMAKSNSGDNNPAKKPGVGEKISMSKTGKSRPDIIGKKYFGADEETIKLCIEKMAKSRQGQEPWNKGLSYTSVPCSENKKQKISESRKRTKDKFIKMTKDEFTNWIKGFNMYRKDGKLNPNITRAIIWRNEKINEYYPEKSIK